MRIILATANQHKIDEITALFTSCRCTWRSLDQYPHVLLPKETGDTFEANALLKAKAVAAACNAWALADDSGLCVDALGGAPGIYSARYAGVPTDMARNITKLLAALRNVPTEQRGAHFVCVMALVGPAGETYLARGRCDGVIADAPRGSGGFGYDPIFWLPDRHKTMAELTPAEKQQISHRARAAQAMQSHLP